MVTLALTIIILILTGQMILNPINLIKPEEGSYNQPNLLVLALEVLLIPKLELFPTLTEEARLGGRAGLPSQMWRRIIRRRGNLLGGKPPIALWRWTQ